ncbi:MAG TPA: hypothetical protein VG860_18145 [Terriglobia bacterium]|jgi:hypothetical protein|nr:hypothetical protein [Terriglobia bacterium]
MIGLGEQGGKKMPTVVIRRGEGEVIEVKDLSVDQVKDLLGMNGHVPAKPQLSTRRLKPEPLDFDLGPSEVSGPDYKGFHKAISDKGREFFKVLKQHPSGISSETLAPLLGFNGGNQIGGLAGGSLGKLAYRFGIKIKRLYTSDVKFENGVRSRMYRPGKDIGELQ